MHTLPSPTRRLCTGAAVALTAACLVATGGAAVLKRRPPDRQVPLVVRVDDRGFHWSDAAIGAAVGFGVALVLAGSLALAGRGDRVTHTRYQREEQR